MFFSFFAAVALLGLMVASASAAGSPLNSSCTTLPGGGVRFDLSPAPPDNCLWQWFLNETVIATENDWNLSLVLKATHQSLTLDSLLDHVHFIAQCPSGYFETNCTTNCSSQLSRSSEPKCPVLSSLVHLSQNVLSPADDCFFTGILALCLVGLVLLLLVGLVVCCLPPKFRSCIWTRTPPWIQTRIPACIRSRVCGTEPPQSSSSPEFEKVPLSDIPRTETV